MGYQEKDGGVVFFKRHPKVVKRKPQQLQMARAKASCPEIISHWFDQCLGPTLEKLDLVGKADRIFNVDESGFPLSWNPTMILTRRGHKSPQAMTPGSGREQITVQTCISGSGQLMAPYVVYKGARVSPYHTIGGPLGTRYKATENGWMNADTFLDWFQLIFIPSLPSCRPVLLLLDGHKSHVGYQIRKVAQENNIHILKLPAHTTHLLQPLDVGVFNHLKRVWQATLGTFTRQEKRIVKKVDFPKLLAEVWQNNKPEWAVGGFQKAGVVPYNPEAVPEYAMRPSELLPALDPEDMEEGEADLDENREITLAEELSTLNDDDDDEQLSGPSVEPAVLSSSSPVQTPISSPVQTPVSPPVQTPVSPPVQTPVSPPVQTPVSPPVSPPVHVQSQASPLLQSPLASSSLIQPPTSHSSSGTSSHISPTPRCHRQSSASSVDSMSSDIPLREFFASLIQKQTPTQPAVGNESRRRLTAVGESLTEEEAIERIRIAEEERRRESNESSRTQKKERRKREKECRERGNEEDETRREGTQGYQKTVGKHSRLFLPTVPTTRRH